VKKTGRRSSLGGNRGEELEKRGYRRGDKVLGGSACVGSSVVNRGRISRLEEELEWERFLGRRGRRAVKNESFLSARKWLGRLKGKKLKSRRGRWRIVEVLSTRLLGRNEHPSRAFGKEVNPKNGEIEGGGG